MLSPLKELLNGYKMILASSSPQRKSILEQVGFKFDIIHSNFDEESVKSCDYETPQDYIIEIARNKVLTVSDSLKESDQPTLIIGADTMVIDGKDIVGKPHTPERAIDMITRWSGGTHTICTGVCMIDRDKSSNRVRKFFVKTDVTFSKLSKETIQSYVDTGESLNKAGGYGNQGYAAALIKSISGDYYNVMGFPINEFCTQLTEFLSNKES